MSSAKSRNFRRRGDEDNDNDEPKITTTTTTVPKPKKPSSQPPKSLLSFADDGEDSPFTRPPPSTSRISSIPKHSSTHKHTAAKDRIAPIRSTKLSNVQPQAGSYTKEALLELQKNTKSLTGARKPKPDPEPVIVLKGLIKPIPGLDDHENLEKSDNDETHSNRNRDDTVTKFGSMGLRGRNEEIGSGSIPDQATIDAIRAKRERLRQSRPAGQDYIALDSGSNHGEAEGLSDEEPENLRRIGFFGEKIDNGKKGVFEDFEDQSMPLPRVGVSSDEDNDEEDEDKMWEEEQVRKGLGKRIDDTTNRVVNSTNVSIVGQSVQHQKFGSNSNPIPSISAPPVSNIGGFSNNDTMSITQQAELARKALTENLKRLKESHTRTNNSLSKTDENLSASLTNVTVLEKSLSATGEKYIFMQKLRDFVSVICEFLQDRAPYIEEVEAELQKLHEERALAISDRRSANNHDEMKEIEAAVNAAMSELSRGGTLESATSAANSAATNSNEFTNLPVKLDELGRDENLQKRYDMTRRSEARRKKRAKSETKRLNNSSYIQIEGESSTDESDSESNAYKSNREQLLQVADQILSKADEDYSNLSIIIERFTKWKNDFSSTYRDSYMSLSVPAIFSPYVRLELLKWDPLHQDSDFIDMNWHSLLFNYGLPEDDSDANLIPELVEKLAIPILHHQLEYCWDILSTNETKFAVSATNLVFRYVSISSSSLGKLVTLINNRLSEEVKKLTIPTWNTIVMKAVPNAGRIAAYRFGISIRLIKNICLWNNILAMPVLEKLVLDEIVNGKILAHLRSIQSNVHDAMIRTERVVAALYGVWTGASVTGDRSVKLQGIVDYLLTIGKSLEKKYVMGGGEMEIGKLARRLKKMLVELNEYDHARNMSRVFNLKEAL